MHALRALRHAFLTLSLLACVPDHVSGPFSNAVDQSTPTRPSAVAVDPPLIVITELMADPRAVADAAGEWFELFNGGEEPVDLAQYRIVSGPTGSETHIIQEALIVPAGGFAVLGVNADRATNGGAPVDYAYGSAITLNNSNTDWLLLTTPGGLLVDSVAYAVRVNGTPGSYTPPSGASRAVIAVEADNTIVAGTNWATATAPYGLGDLGTPGSGPYGPISPGGPVVTVRITPAPASVAIGGTRQLTATGLDAEGRVSSTTFAWVSSAPDVAAVDASTGMVTGLTLGTAIITATAANGVEGTVTLGVTPPPTVASVALSIGSPAVVPVGFTKPAFPTARDAGGAIITPPPAYSWSSDQPAVATVDALGYVTARAIGVARITATAPNGVSGSAPLSVIAADAPTSSVYRNHVEFGIPADDTPDDDYLLFKREYVTSYNRTRGGPNWVSWNLNSTQFGHAPRCDCFTSDVTLPAQFPLVVDFDYRNSGYDRGHMVQSEARTTTEQENAVTFLLTNILPQAPDNNQGPWSRFEIYLNDLARRDGKEIYIITGGEYSHAPPTLKNEGKVTIPAYTWKIAVVMEAGNGLANVTSASSVQVIVVRMPNLTTAGVPGSAVGIRNLPWHDFQTSVDAIEALTGYDFLAELPDEIEQIVESGGR